MEKNKSYKIFIFEDSPEKNQCNAFFNQTNNFNEINPNRELIRTAFNRYKDLEHKCAEFESSDFLLNNHYVSWLNESNLVYNRYKTLQKSLSEKFILFSDIFENCFDNNFTEHGICQLKEEGNTAPPFYIQKPNQSATGKFVSPFLPGCDEIQYPVQFPETFSHQSLSCYMVCPIYKKFRVRKTYVSPVPTSLEKIFIGNISGNTFFYDLPEETKKTKNSSTSDRLRAILLSFGLFNEPDDSFYTPAVLSTIADILRRNIENLILNVSRKIKSLRRKITKIFWRDLRTSYRKIIRFLFKNLSDTSGSDDHFVYQTGKQFIILLKEILYETENRFNQSVKPCYQFQNE